MDLLDKLQVLADAAKYDVSCSSSGSKRKNTADGIGNGAFSGVCHSWSDDGRCISLLKILLSNECVYDCVYCVNRISNDLPRATFTPGEVVDLTVNFYKRNYIEGLFLSSAVCKNPNHTMELMLDTVEKLREEEKFNGYIHLKAIPGADYRLIEKAGTYADRMSVNIELPSERGLKLLAPQKSRRSIMEPMRQLSSSITKCKEERKKYKSAPQFVPAGQSTQLIVGATTDSDLEIVSLSQSLYDSYSLKRVYYSAFIPVSPHRNLPNISTPPLMREHRLYQADWLLRFYGFRAAELLDEYNQNFDVDLDPKCDWALRNIHLFPIEINRADLNMLLRIPGIGVKTARRIITARKFGALSFEDLKKFGPALNRAKYFITCRGKYFGMKDLDPDLIKSHLLDNSTKYKESNHQQMTLFSQAPIVPPTESSGARIGGR